MFVVSFKFAYKCLILNETKIVSFLTRSFNDVLVTELIILYYFLGLFFF